MTLNDILAKLRKQCESNWPTPSPTDSALWLTTEVGELIDELMRLPGYPDVAPVRNNPREGDVFRVADEAADVLIMLISTIEPFGIDLEEAFHNRVQVLASKYSGRLLDLGEEVIELVE